ncbi:MAG: RNA polymerase sigma factor [Thermoflexales bacterium]
MIAETVAYPSAASEHAFEQAMDERELVRRAKADAEAFGVLYEQHVAAIYRYVFYRVGNIEDAEDLTARVFMQALKHIGNYNDRGLPFTAWLYRIAHNVVVNFRRDQRRRPAVPLEHLCDAAHPRFVQEVEDLAHRLDHERRRQRLLNAVRRLPEDRQHLLVLKFVEQLSNAEIGRIMNRSEGAVKSLYHRTLVQLRDLLRKMEEEQ